MTEHDRLLGEMEILPHSNPLYDDDELRDRFLEDPPRLSLPIIWDYELTLDDGEVCKGEDGWGGPPVDDPLTLYLHLPLSEDEQGVVFKCSLEEVIDDLIDSSISPDTRTIVEASAQVTCRRLAARLRELAGHLEQAAHGSEILPPDPQETQH
jgi:hypothetical protein